MLIIHVVPCEQGRFLDWLLDVCVHFSLEYVSKTEVHKKTRGHIYVAYTDWWHAMS